MLFHSPTLSSSQPYADPVYTVSGARDHYREQSRAGGFLLERVPEFNNFFSEIPTHPSQTFRCVRVVVVPPHSRSPSSPTKTRCLLGGRVAHSRAPRFGLFSCFFFFFFCGDRGHRGCVFPFLRARERDSRDRGRTSGTHGEHKEVLAWSSPSGRSTLSAALSLP